MLSPLEMAYVDYILHYGGKAGPKGVYWGAKAGTGTGGVGGVKGGNTGVEPRLMPNGGVNTGGNIADKQITTNADGSVTTVVKDQDGRVTKTTTPAVNTGPSGDYVELKNGGAYRVPSQETAHTEAKYVGVVDSQHMIRLTTTITWSDGSVTVIQRDQAYYGGKRVPSV